MTILKHHELSVSKFAVDLYNFNQFKFIFNRWFIFYSENEFAYNQ